MHYPTLLVATTSLLLPSTLAAGLYTKSSPVLQVNGASYDSLIARSNHTSIVEFYAPWCGHCKNLQPAFEKAAKSLSGLAKVAAVNCDEDANKPFCGSMGVQGFPTLKIVRPGKKPGKPTVEDYQGPRNAKGIVDAVVDKIPNHVTRLKDADFEAWAKKEGPRAVLFTEKGTVSALLKALAIDFLGGIDIGQVRDKEKATIAKYSISKFPTLVLLPGGDEEPIPYSGEMKKAPLLAFLSQVASPNPDPAPKKSKSKSSSSTKTNAKSSSKASSSFSKASASHARSEASASPASQTSETLEDSSNPTESPNPAVDTEKPVQVPVARPIAPLEDALALQQNCLNSKAKTCILALLPSEPSSEAEAAVRALSAIHAKHEGAGRTLFPFYQLPTTNSQAAALRSQLQLSGDSIELLATNGKRAWYRHYSSSSAGFEQASVESWIDEIRMGEGKKETLPEALIINIEDLPAESVKVEEPMKGEEETKVEAEGKVDESMQEKLQEMKDSMPEGLDFEFEEIDDVEYEHIMRRSAEAGKGEQAQGHDEL